MDDEIPKHHSKKDKKKWCKGRVGKEHDPIWVEDNKYLFERLIYQCQACNKEIDIWYVPVGLGLWQKDYIQPVVGQREPKQKKDK